MSPPEDDIETGTRASYGVPVAAAKPAEHSDTKSPEESESKSSEDIDVEIPEDPAPRATPAFADHSSVHAGNHVWEWQHGDHWAAFSDDCKDYIEKRDQEYVGSKGKGKGKGKGQSCIHVKTRGKDISIDFSRMTSKAK